MTSALHTPELEKSSWKKVPRCTQVCRVPSRAATSQRRSNSVAERPTLTPTAGAPVPDNQNSITAGPRGPLLVQDYQLLEKLAHQNRERIPERTVHAKGWGAHGTFTVTKDITED